MPFWSFLICRKTKLYWPYSALKNSQHPQYTWLDSFLQIPQDVTNDGLVFIGMNSLTAKKAKTKQNKAKQKGSDSNPPQHIDR